MYVITDRGEAYLAGDLNTHEDAPEHPHGGRVKETMQTMDCLQILFRRYTQETQYCYQSSPKFVFP